MKLLSVFIDPWFLVGVPALGLGLFFTWPTLLGLGASLLVCSFVNR